MQDTKILCMKLRDEGNEPTIQLMKNIRAEQKSGRFSARGQCSVCASDQFGFMSKTSAETTG